MVVLYFILLFVFCGCENIRIKLRRQLRRLYIVTCINRIQNILQLLRYSQKSKVKYYVKSILFLREKIYLNNFISCIYDCNTS